MNTFLTGIVAATDSWSWDGRARLHGRQLAYKTDDHAGRLVVVDRFHPTSTTCSASGLAKAEPARPERPHVCGGTKRCTETTQDHISSCWGGSGCSRPEPISAASNS